MKLNSEATTNRKKTTTEKCLVAFCRSICSMSIAQSGSLSFTIWQAPFYGSNFWLYLKLLHRFYLTPNILSCASFEMSFSISKSIKVNVAVFYAEPYHNINLQKLHHFFRCYFTLCLVFGFQLNNQSPTNFILFSYQLLMFDNNWTMLSSLNG